MTDDELSERLARALDLDASSAPPADRIAALRARAEERSAAAAGDASSRPATIGADGRRPSRTWLAAAAVVVALVTGFGAARLFDGGDDGAGTAGDVEYDGPLAGPDGEAVDADLSVVGTGIGRVVELRTGALPILPTGEYYQVWFVAPDDAPGNPDRISAGTFHPDPDGRSDVRFAAAVDPELYPRVEITAEPGDGNPLPTGPVVLTASIPG